jgi:hypothetical protein
VLTADAVKEVANVERRNISKGDGQEGLAKLEWRLEGATQLTHPGSFEIEPRLSTDHGILNCWALFNHKCNASTSDEDVGTMRITIPNGTL